MMTRGNSQHVHKDPYIDNLPNHCNNVEPKVWKNITIGGGLDTGTRAKIIALRWVIFMKPGLTRQKVYTTGRNTV